MQQPGPMFPVMPSFPPNNITTEQIQKYLDENKKLILAILDNQNLGKLAECAQYQAQLQKNLMYLAAIADAQPQTQALPPQQMQMSPHPAMQQGGFFMQQPQAAAAAMAQQPGGMFAPRTLPFNTNPHSLPQDHSQQHLSHPLATQGHIAMRPVGPTSGGGSIPGSINSGSKQDKPDDRQGSAAQGGGDGEETK